MARKAEPLVWIRFTGAAGGSAYVYDDGRKVMTPGDQVAVVVEPHGHWAALLASGNGEVVKE